MCNHAVMSTGPQNQIPPEILAGMQAAEAVALSNHRDADAMRRACAQMDRMREEIFRKHGLLDIGVPSIRSLRDGDQS